MQYKYVQKKKNQTYVSVFNKDNDYGIKHRMFGNNI